MPVVAGLSDPPTVRAEKRNQINIIFVSLGTKDVSGISARSGGMQQLERVFQAHSVVG